jgi:hypothetical protein
MLSFELRDALEGRCELWRVWWIAGPALAVAITASIIAADSLRLAAMHSLAAVVEIAGLLTFSLWLRAAWNCAGNVRIGLLTPVVRVGLAASLVGVAVLY